MVRYFLIMAVGDREQKEPYFEKKSRDGKIKKSWKKIKQMHNRRDRHEAKINPETPPRRKFYGWEW